MDIIKSVLNQYINFSSLVYGIQVPINGEEYLKPILDINGEEASKTFNAVISIEKVYDCYSKCDMYVLRLLNLNSRKSKKDIFGYMYFDIDFERRVSRFYGGFTANKYRGNGFSKLLISKWIELCFTNGIYDLKTIDKQRKPILLYQLKEFDFDINDKSMYEEGNNIDICASKSIPSSKVLHFENKEMETMFLRGAVFKDTPHEIIHDISDDYEYITSVLLNIPLDVQDIEKSLSISENCSELFSEQKCIRRRS